MIYLIDEKQKRQQNYGWNSTKFEQYGEILTPIHHVELLEDIGKEVLFTEENIILFHDSFFDTPSNKHEDSSEALKSRLQAKSDTLKIASFSGGVSSRTLLGENFASLHVSWVYKNLAYFLENYSKGDANLKYLVFGPNHKYEEVASLRAQLWNQFYTLGATQSHTLQGEQIILINKIIGTLELDESIKDLTKEQPISYIKHRINSLLSRGIHE